MKIHIQTLKNVKHGMEVKEDETVQQLKSRIHSELQLGEPNEQKLIHLGKILKDEQTMAEAKIKPNDSVVIMISKKKAPATQNTATSTNANTGVQAQAAQAVAASNSNVNAATASTETQTGPPSTSTPATSSTSTAPSSAQTASASPTAPTTSISSSTSAPSASTASSSNLVLGGAALDETVANLMGLGFDREQVQLALRAAFNNPDRAAEYLFSGIPENIRRQFEQPPASAANTQQQQQPSGQAPAAATASSPPASAATSGSAAQQALASLAGMAAGMNSGISGSESGGGANPLAGLAGLANNPEFEQFRAMLQSNPQLIPVILQQLAQTNPELVQALQQNPQMLAQLLGGLGGGGGGGGQSGGRRMIQITAEEKSQLDNLEALGFSRQRALEAWLICDRNYELAANYLLEHGFEEDMPSATGGTGGGNAGGSTGGTQ